MKRRDNLSKQTTIREPGIASTQCHSFLRVVKSWDGLEELGEYGRMTSYSPVSYFQSMACGELIVSKSPAIPGGLVWLIGTAVGFAMILMNMQFACLPNQRIG